LILQAKSQLLEITSKKPTTRFYKQKANYLKLQAFVRNPAANGGSRVFSF